MGSNMAVTAELVIHIDSKHAIIIKANMSLDTAAAVDKIVTVLYLNKCRLTILDRFRLGEEI